jgi:phosphoenolpyruvate-protein kinase (PTS system EI component)
MKKLSMNSSSVAKVKQIIASLTIKKAQEISQKVLEFATDAEAKDYLQNVNNSLY